MSFLTIRGTLFPFLNHATLFRYILARSPRLIEEMINVATQLSFYAQTKVSIETIENLQKLLPMLVQALWQKNSHLMQLPHLSESNINFLRRVRLTSFSSSY